ncbi:hypothetical protein E4U33_001091 [Claviceps sp. LM78 group G4]|nr:hypothetical protein E4U33_001091 [Claviceps sp. LM78 group G4]
MARDMAQQTRLWPHRWVGAYGLPNALFDAWGGPRGQAVPGRASVTIYVCAGDFWRFTFHRCLNRDTPTSRSRRTSFSFQLFPARALAPVSASASAPAPVPARARYATVDASDLCPPMEHGETEAVAPEPIEDDCPTFEAVDVSYATVNPAVIDVS